MNYKISYLIHPDTISTLSIQEARDLTGLEIENVLQQLDAFDYQINGNQLCIPPIPIEKWLSKLLNIQSNKSEIILKTDDRQAMIYLMIYSQYRHFTVYHFQDLLDVSRGTIFNDIAELKEKISATGLDIKYDRIKGYHIVGRHNEVFKLAKNFISRLCYSDEGRYFLFYYIFSMNYTLYGQARDLLKKYIDDEGYRFVLSRTDEIVFLMILSKHMMKSYDFTPIDSFDKIKDLKIFKFCCNLLLNFYELEEISTYNTCIFTICVLTVLQGEIHEPAFDFLLYLSADIIHRVEQLLVVYFSDFKRLLFDFYNHLVPAFFRIKYDLEITNPAMATIYKKYDTLYKITAQAVQPLEQVTKKKTPENEIGYFTILFGGAMNSLGQKEETPANPRALIVCPNGVSSSLILESELKKTFPTITFTGADSFLELGNLSESSYDFIFSTVYLKHTKPVYLVNPIMTQQEKNHLIEKVRNDWKIDGYNFPSANEIIHAIMPYIHLKSGVTEEKLYGVIYHLIYDFNHQKNNDKRKPTHSFSKLITEDKFITLEKIDNWEDAITLASEPLLKNGSIEKRYVNAMIENVKAFGSYIYLGEGIAMPHARPSDGSHALDISILKIKVPIKLLENEEHQVDTFIILSTLNNQSHFELIEEINTIINDRKLLMRFKSINNYADLKQLLNEI
ncbi:BglG family transcription antiterminator [Allofustis seminis]|uniref:BglG family transcription antiterminator n=1 Tax=Allofustis seminis TaxID=166939 RepID=UPI00035DDBC5|nr:PTS sugar transporter subunit IIA [Allofustis seminis]